MKRGFVIGLAAILAVAFLAPSADAASRKAKPKGPQCPSVGTRSVVFLKAADGSSFETADGAQVRLAGLLAPGAGGETLSQNETVAARAALERALAQGSITLAEQGRDRYGRVLAQVFAGGVWVQDALLRQGVARVAPDGPSAVCAALLLKAEGDARTAQTGHWKDGVFAVRSPEQLGNRTGSFKIVEGTV